MKKLSVLAAATAGFVLSLAGTALAEYPPTEGVGGAGGVAGEAGGVGGAGGEVAFTGASVSLGMLILAVLVLAGVAALIMARRRAAPAR